ncbi:MAG: hypothetical protein U0T02_06570 [Solirubrobacteraceae bacterium]
MSLVAALAAGAAVAAPGAPPAVVPAGAAGTGPAGPAISLGLSCYTPAYQTTVRARALYAGFTPGAALGVKVDARTLGQVHADAAGGGGFTWHPPRAPGRSKGGEASHTLTVGDTTTGIATKRFYSTQFSADFSPSAGDPNRLRTRFSVYGFGAGKTLYLHYIPPGSRRSKLNRPLGRLGGACGKLRTPAKRLFPFRPQTGRWALQFDTKRSYSSRTVPRVTRGYIVTIVVRRR